MKQKSKKFNQISSEVSSIVTLPPSRQSTPARPVSLNLHDKFPGKTYVLSKSRTEGSLDQYSDALTLESQTSSSHKSLKKLEKAFKTTLEQRLALEENISIKNKLNKYQQSPIIEEQLSEKVLDSECDSKSEIGRWSPLKVEPLNSLRIELPGKDFHETDENLDMSQDDSQNTPETVTESPNLMRQNSYTLLTPSPALLSFLEAKKTDESSHKIQSGRKTWDIIKAKKNWDASSRDECKSMNDDGSSDEIESFDKKSLSFLEDDFSTLENDGRTTDDNEYVGEISAGNESGTSPDSCGSKKIVSRRLKMKCKVKGTNARSLKSVPSPKANEKVPFKQDNSIATQGAPDFVPLDVKNELSELSNLLLEMKLNHERQKKELEEKQQSEMKKLESIFKKKEAELLNKVCGTPVKSKSVYSQISKLSASKEIHSGMLGDGNHNVGDNEKENSNEEHFMNQFVIRRRPNSAKDFHRQLYNYIGDCNRRAKSMDFNEGNQDTDLDVSFQDDFLQSINRGNNG